MLKINYLMMEKKKNKNIIISGGGTGGHVFPAIAIADALKQADKDINILFVGALGRMEMERVPAAGYEIVGLPVTGFQRKLSFKNVVFFFKLLQSIFIARRIIKSFNPVVVVGVGGYASGPVVREAAKKGIPTLIQEQNSYAGVTNRLLSKKAKKICVAYEYMEKYFPKEKIIITGNPVRQDLVELSQIKTDALKYFNINPEHKVILVMGGSLGARTINQSCLAYLKAIIGQSAILIWQTGKIYHERVNEQVQKYKADNIKLFDFISRIDYAYAAADLIISRAGALTISELQLVGKPAILVPSPNVAENHQMKNAMALVSKDAAIMIADEEAEQNLVPQALELLKDETRMGKLAKHILKMKKTNAAKIIADEILKLSDESIV